MSVFHSRKDSPLCTDQSERPTPVGEAVYGSVPGLLLLWLGVYWKDHQATGNKAKRTQGCMQQRADRKVGYCRARVGTWPCHQVGRHFGVGPCEEAPRATVERSAAHPHDSQEQKLQPRPRHRVARVLDGYDYQVRGAWSNRPPTAPTRVMATYSMERNVDGGMHSAFHEHCVLCIYILMYAL